MNAQQAGIVLYCIVCIFGAAVVRGYSGFGFSMLSVTSLSIFLAPREIIPPLFLLEILASLQLLRQAWRDVHWQSTGWLFFGCLWGTPFGVYALARVPADPLIVVLAVTVLVLALMLARGLTLVAMPGRTATLAVGSVSGVLNGCLGVGGPPVIIFYFGSPASMAAGRASMIAYFLCTDLLALGWQWGQGMLDRLALERAALFAPPLLAGLKVGARWFSRVDPVDFRRWVLRLLMLLAATTGARAAWNLLR